MLTSGNNGTQQQQINQSTNPLVCIQNAHINDNNSSAAPSPLPKSQNSSAINVNSIINGNIAGYFQLFFCSFFPFIAFLFPEIVKIFHSFLFSFVEIIRLRWATNKLWHYDG